MMADLQEKELERRLSLYQVFLKLYEHHSGLLDEILQLENLYQPSLSRVKPHYIQGIVDASTVYVITNLGENQTQALQQPQQIWTVGRDRSSGICIADTYLSRRHAAIQYIENQGFYLIDFNSTNGSFVNGERAYQPIKLQDGDRLRLGSITVDFFLNHDVRILPSVAMELLMQLVPRTANIQEKKHSNIDDTEKFWTEKPINFGLIENLECWHSGLSPEQQSAVLERFFSRTKPDNNS
ncbi:FHA domain-containing protein [Nostocales cyanobacterium LEGE 11386]|nr:FHA domain-containing protein [Nostocales cyanobacterium LEGE 11386]